MRKSLKNKRNEPHFRAFKNYLRRLQELADKGLIQIFHYDECGISLNPSVLRAWQAKGSSPAVLPAERGGKLSVAGFVNRECKFFGYYFQNSFDSACFIECMNAFCETITLPTVVILDNASFHKSAAVKAKMAEWQDKGLRLVFQPAYSPELNLTEHIWKHLKYFWLPIRAYSSKESLIAETEKVLSQIGSEYKISFA